MPYEVGRELQPVTEFLQTFFARKRVALVGRVQAIVQHKHGEVLEPNVAMFATRAGRIRTHDPIPIVLIV